MSQNWRNPFTTFLSLCFLVYDGAGSCLDQFRACLSDSVCNRYLAPMLQACKSGQCNDEGCQQETLRFYRNVPQNVAEMLVMCECEASDQSCLSMKTELHSGTCGDEIRVCQRVLNQCTEESNCRYAVLSSDVFGVFFCCCCFQDYCTNAIIIKCTFGDETTKSDANSLFAQWWNVWAASGGWDCWRE